MRDEEQIITIMIALSFGIGAFISRGYGGTISEIIINKTNATITAILLTIALYIASLGLDDKIHQGAETRWNRKNLKLKKTQ